MINYYKFKEEVKKYAIPSAPIELISQWAVNHTLSTYPPHTLVTHPLYSIEYREFNEAPTKIVFGFSYIPEGEELALRLTWKFSHCDTHGVGATLSEAIWNWQNHWDEIFEEEA